MSIDQRSAADASTTTAFERGQEVLDSIGPGAQNVVDELADISPGLGDQIINWAFGEIYVRPGIARRDRQFVAAHRFPAPNTASTAFALPPERGADTSVLCHTTGILGARAQNQGPVTDLQHRM